MLAGASPRGMSLMLRAARTTAWLAGRSYATPDDLRAVFYETIAHRLCLQPVYELRRTEIIGALMRGIVSKVAAP
jgi:MoxR-like ATPase